MNIYYLGIHIIEKNTDYCICNRLATVSHTDHVHFNHTQGFDLVLFSSFPRRLICLHSRCDSIIWRYEEHNWFLFMSRLWCIMRYHCMSHDQTACVKSFSAPWFLNHWNNVLLSPWDAVHRSMSKVSELSLSTSSRSWIGFLFWLFFCRLRPETESPGCNPYHCCCIT